MNILLTGSTGFIGSNLLKRISKNPKNKVLNLVRTNNHNIKNNNIKYLRCDLKKLKKYKSKIIKFNPEILIHLAWNKIPNFDYKTSKENEAMSIKLFKFLDKYTNTKSIIVSGSCFELYPPNNSYRHFINSKLNILKYLKQKKKEKRFDFQWLRIFYIYGPNQRKDSLIPYLINSINKDYKLILKSPKNSHDFLYINDLCDCIIKCFKKNIGSNIFEVGTGKTTPIKKIIKMIETFKKKKITIQNIKKSKSNKKYKANISLLKKKINWRPKVVISKGIKNTIDQLSQ